MQITAWIPKGGEGIQLQPPAELEDVVKLVVFDDIGQPLMILLQQSPTHLWISKQGDEDFNEMLLKLGIRPMPMKVKHVDMPEATKGTGL